MIRMVVGYKRKNITYYILTQKTRKTPYNLEIAGGTDVDGENISHKVIPTVILLILVLFHFMFVVTKVKTTKIGKVTNKVRFVCDI